MTEHYFPACGTVDHAVHLQGGSHLLSVWMIPKVRPSNESY